jgi:hypothetical protein
MAVEYFGLTTEYTSYYGDGSNYRNRGVTFTCPNTGTMNLISLGAWGKKGAGTAGNVRLAIYDSSNNFVAQGSAEISVSNTTAQWLEHTAFTARGGGSISPTLTGGQTYFIMFSRDSDQVTLGYSFGSANDYDITSGDCTGSDFPATISDVNGTTVKYAIRAGVEAAAGGGGSVVTAYQVYYDRMRRVQ